MPTRRTQPLSGPGLVICFLTITFAAIDWVMSLEPDWFSTIYGAMLIIGQALATLARMIIVAALARAGPAAVASWPRPTGSTTWATCCWPSSCSGPTCRSRSS